jgi:hypothetical protein
MTAPDSPATPPPARPPAAPRVVVDVIIAAPIERVWQALRDPALLAQWFGWDYDKLAAEIEMILAGRGDRDDLHGRRRHGRGRPAPGRGRRRVRARGGRRRDPRPAGPRRGAGQRYVGWRLRRHRRRLADVPGAAGVLARGAARRTIYLAGHREQADGPSLIAAAGLAAIADLAVGERYAATAVTGEPLAGVVRFRTEHQVGVSVDTWGPGLLVLAGRPGSPKSPHGGGFALMTVFGASDETLASLTAAWSAAWRRGFTRVTSMP